MGRMEGMPEYRSPRKRTPEWEPDLRNVEVEPEHQYVSAIYISPNMGEPMQLLDRVIAIAGVGLQGDRYAKRKGAFNSRPHSKKEPRIPDTDRQVTLITLQQIKIANLILKSKGVDPITEDETRRNLVATLSSDQLNALVGKRFKVGEVLMEGVELCEPCRRPPTLLGRSKDGEAFELAFKNRGGLRARILRGGNIHRGARILEI